MKRLITFALVLVMALSLAAPAMAFTTVAAVESDDKPVLAIKLVDLSEGFVTVNFNAPPTNRGYVTNEVVCAVVSMQVPKGYEFGTADVLEFSGVNVSLWQDENFYGINGTADGGGTGKLRYMSSNLSNAIATSFEYAPNMAADNWIRFDDFVNIQDNHKNSAQTYHFAIFGRVLGENAKMTATLKGTGELKNVYINGGATGTGALRDTDKFVLSTIKKDYSVGYFDPNRDRTTVAPNASADVVDFASLTTTLDATALQLAAKEILYMVTIDKGMGVIPAGSAFAIITDENFKCLRMYVSEDPGNESWYRVFDGNKPEDSVKADFWGGVYLQFQEEDYSPAGVKVTTLATGTDAAMFMLLLEKVVHGVFGFDIRSLGNKLTPDWWFNNEGQTVEVAIEPWYAEVTVPPEIEIDIPKTGDAMSAVGFVLIALAGLAVIAVRKVKA